MKRDEASSLLEPSLNAFALENNYYYGGQNQIGPDWDPDLCPTVWSADRGLCEEDGAPWGVFAQPSSSKSNQLRSRAFKKCVFGLKNG